MLFRPIRTLADRFNTLQMGMVSSERVFKLLDEQEHVADTGTYVPKEINGSIKFENVWMAYQDENWILKDLSFEAKPGTTVAIVGATGSGKTTLLAAGNRHLLERPEGCGKMLTYEAPIEYVYDGVKSPRSLVSQSEIPRHLPTFAHGVRNALRRKPEVILVGESRDRETINASIEASQTGHAVYTTTHTNGVAATVQRMLSAYDMSEREERAIALMESLRLIVTQALVPREGGGRVGVREWMKFPEDVREKLMDMNFTEWPNEIQRMINQYGRTMQRSAEIIYEAGIIDRRHYLLLASSTGSG
jgi:defect-in-organelle-trafficking protein DotB